MTTTTFHFASLDLDAASKAADSAEALFATLYSELLRLSRWKLSRCAQPISMSATTLLHNAYIDMSGSAPSFPDRPRFIGYASRVMRGLIIDHVRRRHSEKRGGSFELVDYIPEREGEPPSRGELLEISDALDELAKVDPTLVEVVNLKFFCGFSFAEIAAMQNISERTVQRTWDKARIYLHQSMRPDLQTTLRTQC
jgi:RNA polymerase sigma factor (TIGR02999 family)